MEMSVHLGSVVLLFFQYFFPALFVLVAFCHLERRLVSDITHFINLLKVVFVDCNALWCPYRKNE
jgi:hypothetical protein